MLFIRFNTARTVYSQGEATVAGLIGVAFRAKTTTHKGASRHPLSGRWGEEVILNPFRGVYPRFRGQSTVEVSLECP